MADLQLEKKRAALALDEVEIDGSFSGYASVFGIADLGHDVIERGAFARSLQQRGVSGVRMLWQHDAAEPIGVWTTIREDVRGLYVEGRLAKGVARAREALELMRQAGWMVCPSAFAPSRRARMPAPDCATSPRPICGKYRLSLSPCCPWRGST